MHGAQTELCSDYFNTLRENNIPYIPKNSMLSSHRPS